MHIKNKQVRKLFFLVALKEGRIDIQNTLLKTLEEPAQGIHFFIHIPDHITLLPTIASRVELVTITRTGDTQNPSSESDQESTEDEVIIDAETFLSEAPSARLAHIKKLKDASELSKSSTGIYYQFLSSIEHILGAHRHHASLAHIYRAKEYMSESGSSPKMILEYLAMHLPIIAKD
ncbi:MAG: hypothetical protein LRY46_03150 [Candidatus Pacebacteria bacterium]|nr:hypothetical protein [Candidatus Paceibacterota bacterium]